MHLSGNLKARPRTVDRLIADPEMITFKSVPLETSETRRFLVSSSVTAGLFIVDVLLWKVDRQLIELSIMIRCLPGAHYYAFSSVAGRFHLKMIGALLTPYTKHNICVSPVCNCSGSHTVLLCRPLRCVLQI
jgi:hypothetical protein